MHEVHRDLQHVRVIHDALRAQEPPTRRGSAPRTRLVQGRHGAHKRARTPWLGCALHVCVVQCLLKQSAARPADADVCVVVRRRSTGEGRPWRCPACTLVNARAAALCAACAAPAPAAGADALPSGEVSKRGSVAAPAAAPAATSGGPGGQAGRAALGALAAGGAWACRFCTLHNAGGAERCGACDQWRYASGLPMPALAGDLVL